MTIKTVLPNNPNANQANAQGKLAKLLEISPEMRKLWDDEVEEI